MPGHHFLNAQHDPAGRLDCLKVAGFDLRRNSLRHQVGTSNGIALCRGYTAKELIAALWVITQDHGARGFQHGTQ
jgi:hypothetical protein